MRQCSLSWLVFLIVFLVNFTCQVCDAEVLMFGLCASPIGHRPTLDGGAKGIEIAMIKRMMRYKQMCPC